jgi:hypothetical protein
LRDVPLAEYPASCFDCASTRTVTLAVLMTMDVADDHAGE